MRKIATALGSGLALVLAMACESESPQHGASRSLNDAMRLLEVGGGGSGALALVRTNGAFVTKSEARAAAPLTARIESDCGVYVRAAGVSGGVRLRPGASPLRPGAAREQGSAVLCEDAHASAGVALTVTSSGVKEDIVLERPLRGALTFAWDLELDEGLSAEASRKGDILVRGAIGEGRTRAIYKLPAPVIRDARGQVHADVARFELAARGGGRYGVTLLSRDLSALPHPLTIDPSITVTLTAEFSVDGAGESNASIASDAITRSGLTRGIASWAAGTSMNRARLFHASVAHAGHVYAIGGCGDAACTTLWNDVEMAAIQPDGTLGAWTTTPTNLGAGRYHHAAVAAQGYVYVAAGVDSSAQRQDVLYAKIASDGTPGTWFSASSLPITVSGHTLVAQGGRLYALAGVAGGPKDTIYRADIHADGTLGVWALDASTLPAGGRYYQSGFAADNRIVLGGGWFSGLLGDAITAKLNPDGTVGSWFTASSNAYTSPLFHAGAYFQGQYYTTGGCNGTSCSNNDIALTYQRTVSPSGFMGPAMNAASMTAARYGHALATYGDRLYATGGGHNGSVLSSTEMATPASPSVSISGGIVGGGLMTSRTYHAALSYNGNLYVVGGVDGSGTYQNTVLVSAIGAGGLNASFAASPQVFTTGRMAEGAAAYNGRLYVIGGSASSFPFLHGDVQMAALNPDGSLGAFQSGGSSLNTARGSMATVAYNGYLYVVSGGAGSTDLADVEISQILPDGTAGPWFSSAQTLGSQWTGRSGASVFVHDRKLYLMGGCSSSCTTWPTDIWSATILSDGSLDTNTWANVGSLPAGIPNGTHYAFAAQNGYVYGLGSPLGQGTILYAKIADDGTLSGTSWQSSTESLQFPSTGATSRIVSWNNTLYAPGAKSGASSYGAVTIAQHGEPTGLGTWVADRNLPEARFGHATATDGRTLYVLGGYTGAVSNAVRWATVGPDGSLGTWQSGPSLVTARSFASAFVKNGWLYVIGGENGGELASVEAASIDASTGAPSAFTTLPFSLPSGRAKHAQIVTGNHVYVLGGRTSGLETTDVFSADIAADGSLSPFVVRSSFTTARSRFSGFAYDGRVVLAGGAASDGSALADMQSAPILANGQLGAFTFWGALDHARIGAFVDATNGFARVLGGNPGSGYWSDTATAPMYSGGRVGHWNGGWNFGTPRQFESTASDGAFVWVTGGQDGSGALTSVQRSALATVDGVGVYARTFDLGPYATHADSLVVSGTASRNGKVRVQIRTADSGGIFGAITDLGEVDLGVAVGLGPVVARYVWVRAFLDDTREFPASIGGDASPRDITDITISYSDPCTGVTCTAQDQCHVAGTCDPSTGLCSNPPKPNGSSCDDGNLCTQLDTCQFGSCAGANPVGCNPLDQCHAAGTCDPATGLCSNPAKPDFTPCDDGNACTQTDTCAGGVCGGHNPVVCTALDACHSVGTCDPFTGLCGNPNKPDGTGCNDGNACTQTDTCQSGSCTGANPVSCTALDQCHTAGTCNPGTGICTNPNKTDGSGCNDGNACTQIDTCQSGSCTGGNPVVCTALDSCHAAGTCNTGTGACSNPTQPDGTACSGGTCASGFCTPADAGGSDGSIDASGDSGSDSSAGDSGGGDASGSDSGGSDASTDGGSADASGGDSGAGDAGGSDSGGSDSGVADAGGGDSGSSDSGIVDSGASDSGVADAGGNDSGASDSGAPDSSGTDAGGSDSGGPDASSADAASGVDSGRDAAPGVDAAPAEDAAGGGPVGEDAATSSDAASGVDGGNANPPGEDAGCSCTIPGGATSSTPGWAPFTALALAFVRRRRRARRNE